MMLIGNSQFLARGRARLWRKADISEIANCRFKYVPDQGNIDGNASRSTMLFAKSWRSLWSNSSRLLRAIAASTTHVWIRQLSSTCSLTPTLLRLVLHSWGLTDVVAFCSLQAGAASTWADLLPSGGASHRRRNGV